MAWKIFGPTLESTRLTTGSFISFIADLAYGSVLHVLKNVANGILFLQFQEYVDEARAVQAARCYFAAFTFHTVNGIRHWLGLHDHCRAREKALPDHQQGAFPVVDVASAMEKENLLFLALLKYCKQYAPTNAARRRTSPDLLAYDAALERTRIRPEYVLRYNWERR